MPVETPVITALKLVGKKQLVADQLSLDPDVQIVPEIKTN